MLRTLSLAYPLPAPLLSTHPPSLLHILYIFSLCHFSSLLSLYLPSPHFSILLSSAVPSLPPPRFSFPLPSSPPQRPLTSPHQETNFRQLSPHLPGLRGDRKEGGGRRESAGKEKGLEREKGRGRSGGGRLEGGTETNPLAFARVFDYATLTDLLVQYKGIGF